MRGNLIIMGFIMKPRFDAEMNKEITEVYHVNCLDIMGYFPKWMVNAVAKTVPQKWFGIFEREAMRYEANELKEILS